MQHEKPAKATREVTATNAKARFAELLDAVERGETVVITRHGKSVARLAPEATARKEAAARFLAKLDEFRKTGPKLTIEEILSARHEGHKY